MLRGYDLALVVALMKMLLGWLSEMLMVDGVSEISRKSCPSYRQFAVETAVIASTCDVGL